MSNAHNKCVKYFDDFQNQRQSIPCKLSHAVEEVEVNTNRLVPTCSTLTRSIKRVGELTCNETRLIDIIGLAKISSTHVGPDLRFCSAECVYGRAKQSFAL